MTFTDASPVRLFVLGNQKSGTSAIAHLLADQAGYSKTIDVPRRWRSDSRKLAAGQLSFGEFVAHYPSLFQTQLVKLPSITFVADQIPERFPQAGFLAIIRDPRDNLRSLLNRRKLPGHLRKLSWLHRMRQRLQGRITAAGSIWGQPGDNYIAILARRWNRAVKACESLESNGLVTVRYEDFDADKIGTLRSLAEQLRLPIKHDVSDQVNRQYQPAGDRAVAWGDFFGDENLGTIESICREGMRRYGYS